MLPQYASLDEEDTEGIYTSATFLGENCTLSASKGRGLALAFTFEDEGNDVSPTGDAGGVEMMSGGGDGLVIRRILSLASEMYEDREKGLNGTFVGDEG